jgi:hypothetical protein
LFLLHESNHSKRWNGQSLSIYLFNIFHSNNFTYSDTFATRIFPKTSFVLSCNVFKPYFEIGGLHQLAFLWCVLLFGCLWYMSSQARQNTWSEHTWHLTIAVEVPHKSHGGKGPLDAGWAWPLPLGAWWAWPLPLGAWWAWPLPLRRRPLAWMLESIL